MLPDWIKHTPMNEWYETNLKPCICERCDFVWYPRINQYGEISLKICPKCKSKLWNKPKKS